MIWKNEVSNLKLLNEINSNCLPGHLGIIITEIGDDYIKATMPIDNRTKQPMGLLHGGASVALSETVGSIAAIISAGPYGEYTAVGVEINANHLKAGKKGLVHSITKPIRVGKTIQVWNTDIFDEEGHLLCTSRLTVMVQKLNKE
ncbi:MAG: hypothetical protein RLZZ546_2300 [Bacteroidota bacterium]|jgi:1,4-dihydroxy-2-naphthoyl-CoA hydrolase